MYSWRKFQTYAFRSTFFFNRVCETVVYKFISLRKNGSPKQRLKIILHRNNRNNSAGINLINTRDVLLRIKGKKKKKLCKNREKKLLEQMLEGNPTTAVVPSTRIPLERGQSAAKPIKRGTNMFQDW